MATWLLINCIRAPANIFLISGANSYFGRRKRRASLSSPMASLLDGNIGTNVNGEQ